MKKILFLAVMLMCVSVLYAQLPTESNTGIKTAVLKSKAYVASQKDTSVTFRLAGATKAEIYLAFSDSASLDDIYIDRRDGPNQAWAVVDSVDPAAFVPSATANLPVYYSVPLLPGQPPAGTMVVATHGSEDWAGRVMNQYRVRIWFASTGNSTTPAPTYQALLKYK